MSECSVCYEKKPTLFLKCKHLLCYLCLVKSGKLQCPMCRQELNELSDETKELTNYIGAKDKNIIKLENEIQALKLQLKEYDTFRSHTPTSEISNIFLSSHDSFDSFINMLPYAFTMMEVSRQQTRQNTDYNN